MIYEVVEVGGARFISKPVSIVTSVTYVANLLTVLWGVSVLADWHLVVCRGISHVKMPRVDGAHVQRMG